MADTKINDFWERDMARFIGPHQERYLYQFRRLSEGKATFHFPCAFWSLEWMAYRRMYKYAAISLLLQSAIIVCITFAEDFYARQIGADISAGVDVLMKLILFLAFGIMGNRLYRKKVFVELSKLNCKDAASSHEYDKQKRLSEKGEPSVFAVFVLIAIEFISIFIISKL